MTKPSEKAMQIISSINTYHGCRVEHDVIKWKAEDIDTHTAQAMKNAVAEYQAVLAAAEEALQQIDRENREPFHKAGTVARKALAAIAELQTNEKLG